jgi:2-iminobutanoate/2-iminopropanoate deaminase
MSDRQIVATDRAPRPLQGAPYSQAVAAGGMVFCSGQLGLDPETGGLVDGGVAAQAARALDNLRGVLEAAGSSLERVVKTTVFVTDLGDFATVNAVYAGFFTGEPPARSTVQVAALPAGGLVEIEAVALAGG